MLQHDYGWQAGATPWDGSPTKTASWHGLVQYLYYDVSDKLAVGVRGEWFRDDDGTRVAGPREARDNPPARLAAANYYGLSLGANVKPNANLTIRPEVRWDWQVRDSAAAPLAYDSGNRSNQFLVGVDLILRF